MELLVIVVLMVGLGVAGRVAGADSRPSFDEPQHRQI